MSEERGGRRYLLLLLPAWQESRCQVSCCFLRMCRLEVEVDVEVEVEVQVVVEGRLMAWHLGKVWWQMSHM